MRGAYRRSLILDLYDLPVVEDRKSGRTAADIDDDSVRNLIDGICSGRLINDICYLKAGGLRYILVCPRAGFRSCRHGNGTVDELLAQTLLQLSFSSRTILHAPL